MNEATSAVADTPRTDELLDALREPSSADRKDLATLCRELERENTQLRAALVEIRDMFDGEEDASCEPGEDRFTPNRAMQVNSIIDAVL